MFSITTGWLMAPLLVWMLAWHHISVHPIVSATKNICFSLTSSDLHCQTPTSPTSNILHFNIHSCLSASVHFRLLKSVAGACSSEIKESESVAQAPATRKKRLIKAGISTSLLPRLYCLPVYILYVRFSSRIWGWVLTMAQTRLRYNSNDWTYISLSFSLTCN